MMLHLRTIGVLVRVLFTVPVKEWHSESESEKKGGKQ